MHCSPLPHCPVPGTPQREGGVEEGAAWQSRWKRRVPRWGNAGMRSSRRAPARWARLQGWLSPCQDEVQREGRGEVAAGLPRNPGPGGGGGEGGGQARWAGTKQGKLYKQSLCIGAWNRCWARGFFRGKGAMFSSIEEKNKKSGFAQPGRQRRCLQ